MAKTRFESRLDEATETYISDAGIGRINATRPWTEDNNIDKREPKRKRHPPVPEGYVFDEIRGEYVLAPGWEIPIEGWIDPGKKERTYEPRRPKSEIE